MQNIVPEPQLCYEEFSCMATANEREGSGKLTQAESSKLQTSGRHRWRSGTGSWFCPDPRQKRPGVVSLKAFCCKL